MADKREPGALPVIERLSLRDGRLTYYDYASNTRISMTLAEVQATTTGPEQRLEVEGAGQFADLPFRLTGHGGALQDLNDNKPYPLQVQLVVDQWQVDLNGTVAQPLQMQGVAGECPWRACSQTSRLAPRSRRLRLRQARGRID